MISPIQPQKSVIPTVAPPTGRQIVSTPLRIDTQDQVQVHAPIVSLAQTVKQAYTQELTKIRQIGPRLEQLPDFSRVPFKVGIALAQTQGHFQLAAGQIKIETPKGPIDLGYFEQTEFKVQAGPNQFILSSASQSWGPFQGKLIVDSNTAAPIRINGKSYRGDLEVIMAPGQTQRIHLLNTVLLEDYLKSVVPSESPASWPQESLRAQALAARTYAVASWQKRIDQGYDVNADTSDQVYKGLASEYPTTNQAVESTRGQIMVHQGRPITALFFSTSGGHTDSSAEVWNTPLPYIQPKPDFDWASPRYRWEKTYSHAELEKAIDALGADIGQLEAIEIVETTPHQRVKTLRVKGNKGEALLNANAFRFAARLYSTLWTVKPTKNGFVFNGGGWGHGLGMSQWGARQMAADGFNAQQIVQHYYTDIALHSLLPPLQAE